MRAARHPDRLHRSGVCCVAAALLFGACAPASDRVGDAARATNSVDAAAPSDSSAVAFASAFYAAYVPRGNAGGLAAVDSLIAERPELFAPPLLRALAQDAAARQAARGEIVGLDFDPFLDSQDPCERYEVSKGTRVGATVHVDVHAVCQGQRSVAPTVIAVVESGGSGPMLADVMYPVPGTSLIQVLRQLHP
jgi:hypothetical protein